MSGGMLETLEESDVRQGDDDAFLIYVLSYDDLLADRGVALPLDRPRPLHIGRAEDDGPVGFRSIADLRVPDGWMSGEHAVLERTGNTDVIRDLGSRNGTRVNGQRITTHTLRDGDLIEVGHSLFVYRLVPEALREAMTAPVASRTFGPTASASPRVLALARDLGRIAPSAEPVLVLAETGAGKEHLARVVHERSGRRGALAAIDCGAVPDNLFESTFFGHEKGAFTGADSAREGELVRAHGGTVFLDEVGNMSETAQAKLLRVIETGEVTPVGATRARRVDLRWVAATNRELLGSSETFREDLVRRLAGFVARIPPLRARKEDLGALAAYFLRDLGVAKAAISAGAARALFCSAFPGNIRELRAKLRAAALLAGDGPIRPEHLPSEPAPEPSAAAGDDESAAARASTPSREDVVTALTATGGNVTQAAKRLGTNARQLYRWIERLAIDLDELRS